MGNSDTLELLVRGAGAGGFIGLALGVARTRGNRARLTGVLFCLGAASHILSQWAVLRGTLGPADLLVWAMSVAETGFLWAFAVDLFSDRARPSPWRLAPAAVLLAIGIFAKAFGPTSPVAGAAWIVHSLVSLGLMTHALVVIAGGHRGDLVERRRRLRGPVLGAGALYAVFVAAMQIIDIFWTSAAFLSLVLALIILALSLAGVSVFLRADPDFFPRAAPVMKDPAPSDAPALSRLNKAMDHEEVWRREALAISDLARTVGVPEHRLRRIINDGLGYRNFTAFLNERRIAAAKAALADPDRTAPVSSIAYEVGFASLGPFNRAFKEATGLTPTLWRERQEVAENA